MQLRDWKSRFLVLILDFQGFSRTRVSKNFQCLKFLELENPWNSRQGRGLCFQGFFFNFKEWLMIMHQGFFKDFQGIPWNPRNSNRSEKHNVKTILWFQIRIESFRIWNIHKLSSVIVLTIKYPYIHVTWFFLNNGYLYVSVNLSLQKLQSYCFVFYEDKLYFSWNA